MSAWQRSEKDEVGKERLYELCQTRPSRVAFKVRNVMSQNGTGWRGAQWAVKRKKRRRARYKRSGDPLYAHREISYCVGLSVTDDGSEVGSFPI